jgi:hypothetical protein
MITTWSKFYYGYDVTADNNQLDFSEGGSELTAEIAVGSYTPTDFCTAVKTALDTAGALTYTVTFNRSTRKITIAATGTFQILKATGTHIGTSPFTLMGFTGAGDLTGTNTYTGASVSGDIYSPQFKLQDYISSDDYQQAVDATVNKTASGRVEVVKFGTESFIECNITFVTDRTVDGTVIRSNATGVADLRRFLQYLVTKGPCEFIPDEDTVSTYQKVMLESTPDSDKGTGYRIKELYDKGLSHVYQTGKLKFRVLE